MAVSGASGPDLATALLKCFGAGGDFSIDVVTGDDALVAEQRDAEAGSEPLVPKRRVVATFTVWSKLLAAWSDVFAAMLTHDLKEKTEMRLEIPDASVTAVSAFLRFFYSGILDVSAGDLLEVAVLADKYAVTLVQETCPERLNELLTPESACEILAAAERLGAHTMKARCLQCIFIDPKKALRGAHVFSTSLLDEVLTSDMLCIDDFSLGMLLLELARHPAVQAQKVNVGEIFKKHVQLAALQDDQYRNLLAFAAEVDHSSLLEDMWKRCQRGSSTTDLFGTLWIMYNKAFPNTTSRPPFIGFWINIIPSVSSFGANATANNTHYLIWEYCARGSGHLINLTAKTHIMWMLPMYGLYVSGVSFGGALTEGSSIQVYASRDGEQWQLLVDLTNCTKDSGSIVACSSKEPMNWFKLCVRKGSFSNFLRLHGIVVPK